jgi:hypothetical protein
MKRLDGATYRKGTVPIFAQRKWDCSPSKRLGYTLVEMLVATALTLMMMYAVVSIFADIGEGVNDSRAVLEMTERLRATTTRLQLDLAGITALPRPPRRVEFAEGYLEIKEGPNLDWSVSTTSNIAWDTDAARGDTTVGDFDDWVMFTTRSTGRPFHGRCASPSAPVGVIESDVAEVCWFVRGRTLYRRVLLVAPSAPIGNYTANGFYANNDISVRYNAATGNVVPNTLADLTKRENRFAHNPTAFPFDARGWGLFGLPTLGECSDPTWQAGNVGPTPATANQMDFWGPNPFANWDQPVDPETGTWTQYPDGTRTSEDVILTNVIGFDVKVYDPDVGDYVDLGAHPNAQIDTYPSAPRPTPRFYASLGDVRSGLEAANQSQARVYCTWSDHYERDGNPQLGIGTDAATNGFDDDGANGVDDVGERDTMPPYPYPLRGIQVKIRVFEPDSQQVREMTVVQEFLPK